MKRNLMVFLLLVALLFSTQVVAAEDATIKVVLNGKKINFDVPPTVINGRTMVPVRAIFESLNATVEWDGETETITSYKDDTKIILKLNNNVMSVNGKNITLDVPASAIDNRTLVPVRAISEAFGCKVAWDATTKTVVIDDAVDLNANDVIGSNRDAKPIEWDYDYYMNTIGERISVGYDSVAIVDPNNNLFGWGNNTQGYFPIEKEFITRPLLVRENVTKAAIGNDFFVVLFTDGTVRFYKDKAEIKLTFPNKITNIACGKNHCLALDKDGNVYGWGANEGNVLALSNIDYVESPQKILSNVEMISAGTDSSFFLLKNKTLISTKALDLVKSEKIGIAPITKETIKYAEFVSDIPKIYQFGLSIDSFIYSNPVLKLFSNEKVLIMFPKNYASYGEKQESFDYTKVVLTKTAELKIVDSDLYVSGDITSYKYNDAKLMDDVEYVVSLECGACLVVLKDGSVWTFGKNENYALGDGKKNNSRSPIPVLSLFPELSESNTDAVKISVLSADDFTDGYNIEVQFEDDAGNIITPSGLVTVEVYSNGESLYYENVYLNNKDYKKQVATIILPSHKLKSYSESGEAYITFKNAYTLSDKVCSIGNLPQEDITFSDVVAVIKDYISDIQYERNFTLYDYNYNGEINSITKIHGFKITDVKISYSDNLRVWFNVRGTVVGDDYCVIKAKCYDAYGYVIGAPVVLIEKVANGEEFYLEDSFFVPLGTKRVEFVAD